MNNDVFVVSTGTANVASVRAAFERIAALEGVRCSVRLVEDAREIELAETLVLPGVGAFAAAMQTLHRGRFIDALHDRIAQGRKTMCVCLGMQLLALTSEENPGVRGLGIINREITRFVGNIRVPHIGWNQIKADPNHRNLSSGLAYFANSYRLPFDEELIAGEKWKAATCDYGSSFVAGLEYEEVLACQFHPELSGAWGQSIIRRWWLGPQPDQDKQPDMPL